MAFDPTPSAAPASSQQVPGLPTADVAHSRGGPEAEPSEPVPETPEAPDAVGGSSSGATLVVLPASLFGALALGAVLVGARTHRHRRLEPRIAAEAQVAELGETLERLGWRTPHGATLLGVEDRLRRSRRRAASRYVGRLRAIRYAPNGGLPPGLAERRALRRDLRSALGGRLRAFVAIPPGGPRLRGRR